LEDDDDDDDDDDGTKKMDLLNGLVMNERYWMDWS